MKSLAEWLSVVLLSITAYAANPQFLGRETCALCHKDIAAAQEQTAMANTWQGGVAAWLPSPFNASVSDDLPYQLTSGGSSIAYSVGIEDGKRLTLPSAISMGGRRHGLGFLAAIQQVGGIPLSRPVLVQARYAWSAERSKLLLAPGCSAARPQSLESALGLVLSPTFEARCLACHGQPNSNGSGKSGGVHCEACHGPGSEHPISLSKQHAPQPGIIDPRKLSNEESIEVCARCHVGLARFSDPSAADLLIANQVRAIRSSECFLQSGKAFSCTTCHDPHRDASNDDQAIKACLGCHAAKVTRHAAICPINQSAGCIGCHMPAVEMGALHLVDHLIRVHPEQAHSAGTLRPELRSTQKPISEYLRIIATNTREAAVAAEARLNAGQSFYSVARELSVDSSAAIGGYLGRRNLNELESSVQAAATTLQFGETSPMLKSEGRWVIVQRLPRDFRWQAETTQDQAEALAAAGNPIAAIGKSQEALMIYPHFLRALIFIGATFTQSGNPKKGADVLSTALRLYPEDANAEYALAASLNLAGDQSAARQAYQRTIALDQDYLPAYLNLGLIALSANDTQTAIQTFQQGLQIDPLSAELNYNLGMALTRSGNTSAGSQATDLARQLLLK